MAGADPHRRRRDLAAAILIAAIALLALPALASANFVYWSSATPNSSIGRAKLNGSGLNTRFISGLANPTAVAVNSKFIYWTDSTATRIGRANLDGSGVNQTFITTGVGGPEGLAVTSTGIYWANDSDGTIGRANIDGSNPVHTLFTPPSSTCGLAADSSFLYFLNGSSQIGRATLDGSGVDPGFISVGLNGAFCGPAVDSSYVYYASDAGNTVGRAPVTGGAANEGFIPAGTTGGGPTGVAVNSQYVFWGNDATGAIGGASVNGTSPNPSFIPAAAITGPGSSPAGSPSQFIAAPANKITINSITRKKKKGTAAINAKVPGPGQVTLNQTSSPPDTNAVASAVKQVGLTVNQASPFTLPVKPTGKTAKKLKKQVKKKGKGKVKQTVFIHFVPLGGAGVPNDQAVT